MKFNKKTVNTVDQNQLVPKDVDVCKFDLNSDLNLNFENWRITGSSILCAKPYGCYLVLWQQTILHNINVRHLKTNANKVLEKKSVVPHCDFVVQTIDLTLRSQ